MMCHTMPSCTPLYTSDCKIGISPATDPTAQPPCAITIKQRPITRQARTCGCCESGNHRGLGRYPLLSMILSMSRVFVTLVSGAKSGAVNERAGQFRHTVWLARNSASALRTSASDNPNCRAISVGFTPALNAARTAFNFPVVKGTPTNFNRCFRTGVLSATTGLVQRRFCSASTAAISRSSS